MVQKNDHPAAKKSAAKEKTAHPKTKKTAGEQPQETTAAAGAPETARHEPGETAKKKTVRRKKTTAEMPSAAPGSAPAAEKPKKIRRTKKAAVEQPSPAAELKPEAAAEKPAVHPAAHPAPAPAPKPEVKPAAKPEVKPAAAAHPAVKPEVRQPAVHLEKKPAPAPSAAPSAAPAHAPSAPSAAAAAPVATVQEAPKAPKGEIKINELVTIRELAEKMKLKPGDLLKKMLALGSLGTINQRLEKEVAVLLAHEFGYDAKFESFYAEEALGEAKEDPAKLKPRAPVVTIMGHVDHGKTSLLDSIRKSRIAEGEAGGITQHIGAYKVKTPHGTVAFLDTPGHEAFTAMRSRGAQATDIVVLVVSAADGVMPQTVEAIDHARAAGVPIIVAINKIDLPTANPSQVKQELSKYNLLAEDWGGDTIMVEVSAKRNMNIDQLLEMVLLKAEMMELKANPDRMARGIVIEAKLDARRGPVATVLVQTGTLRVGDNFVVGNTYGKVRAMIDEHGHRLEVAPPSTPAEILGLNKPPQSGDVFISVEQEYQAREIAESRQEKAREESLKPRHHLSLEDISQGKVQELRIILKTDVQGSLEALADSLERLSTAEIALHIIRRGVGAITESDVSLAAASDALIMGFNIRPDAAVEKMADQEGVSIQIYRIIYEVIADVKAAMEGLLSPQIKEITVGKAQVKQVFKVSKVGTVSGSMVTDGKIIRGAHVRLVRDNVIVYEGTICSLHRFKDDVREVEKGFECGIGLENYADVKPGDIMEVFTQEKVARKL
jgi:translation initiation factor IF-2